MQVYIIRHAQSTNNALGENQTDRVQDPHITETGWEQAKLTAQYLKSQTNVDEIVRYDVGTPEREQHTPWEITHLYCSAMRRCLQTANPIGEALGVKPEVWVEIHEFGGVFLDRDGTVTGYKGITRRELESEFVGYTVPENLTDDGWYRPENGMEDRATGIARAIRVAADLRQRSIDPEHKDDRIILVTHGLFSDALIKTLHATVPSDRYFHWLYNASITRVDFLDDGRVIFRYVNRIDHLPSHLVT